MKSFVKGEDKKEKVLSFFSWLFDKNFNIDELVGEEDLTLPEDYKDKNIYYTPAIYQLFSTRAMQRLGRISQLGTLFAENKGCCHSRLEHSKGAYNRKLEELMYFVNEMEGFKKYVEDKGLKIYLIAELVKAATHDIGHLPLSHVLEIQVLDDRGFHERMGKRILLEDEDIRKSTKCNSSRIKSSSTR